jgi:NAD(P)-dependent dehydrogenase (short-subunit alcohol dehydrogenase family)
LRSERFHGKVALVTGGGSGIGRATALQLGREGACVAVADLPGTSGPATVRLLEDEGVASCFIAANVAIEQDVVAMVAAAVEAFGRLDCAVNNAGIEGSSALTAEYDVETWRQVLDVNLSGVFLCMRSELREMVRQKGGVIVNTASLAGVTGIATLAAYCASKHGVVGLTRTAALEYAAHGIRINCICPGFIETPMVMERGEHPASQPEVYRMLADLHPVDRLGRPDEIAEAIAWLACDAASFVTGHVMLADGGIAAGLRPYASSGAR